MNTNLNTFLDRTHLEKKLKDDLLYLEKNKDDITNTRGFYIYGDAGIGKTTFVKNVLKDLNYDVICYDSSDTRNKSIVEKIAKNTMSDRNVVSMFHKKPQKIAIIIDEVDGMNSGDKATITSLIKLIRGKKTKRQKEEDTTMTPVLCIGNRHVDKKIGELMKACICLELKKPTQKQTQRIIEAYFPNIQPDIQNAIIKYVDGDIRKILSMKMLYTKSVALEKNMIENIFQNKTLNEDAKETTKNILNNHIPYDKHNISINETDRTSVALLYHENIIDILQNLPHENSIPFYLDVLNTYTYSDYIDRITFQKQIWVFNELTSQMKIFHNNHKLHTFFTDLSGTQYKKWREKFIKKDVRFTKILTKYSTEYNNMLFIQNIARALSMDKKDVLSYFVYLRDEFCDESKIVSHLEHYDISKLEVHRMYRFIDRYTKASYEDE